MSKITTPVNGRLPVFVFPSKLVFIIEDRSSHRQTLMLYNPYEFNIKYIVTCTESRNYSVTDSEGKLKAGSSIEIMIRHKNICAEKKNKPDKFRIKIYDMNTKFTGKKDILCTIINSDDNPKKADEVFEKIDSDKSGNLNNLKESPLDNATNTKNPSLVFVMAAVLCMSVLLLPTSELDTQLTVHGSSWSFFPKSLNITISQKLIASYILGLLTMVILKY